MPDDTALLALVRRQRELEWKASHALLRERSHDLRNLIQIVELASTELAHRVDGVAAELVGELARTAIEMKRAFEARPRAPIAEAVRAAIELLRPAVGELAVTQRLEATTHTALSPDEVELLVVALVIDGGRHAAAIDLLVRERVIDGSMWVELVCGIDAAPGELRAVKTVAERVGGELVVVERRGGGNEIAVALPTVPG
jgi:hypothetical protein